MNNVGEIKTFILNGNTPTQPMRYVWKWWDGTVDVTTSGTVSKQLNTGGNPADGYQLRYACEAVNEVGQSSEFYGAISVNNPPSVVLGSTSLSKNGGDFSFRTKASIVAYDIEGSDLAFEWYAGGNYLGPGNTRFTGVVSGTYAGTYCGEFGGTNSYVNYDVVENGSLICRVYDLDGGTQAIPFYLFGQSPAQAYTAPTALAWESTIDAASSPTVRIGVNQYAEFTVYTQENANPTEFVWTFHGSNGWATTTYSTGTTTELENGAYKNQALKATYGQTAGPKVGECRLRDILTGNVVYVNVPVYLETNTGPEILSYEILPSSPTVGDILSFAVTAIDADLDLISVKWYFPDLGKTLYGRQVFIDSTGISPGNPMHATVTVTDRLGQSVSQNVESDIFS